MLKSLTFKENYELSLEKDSQKRWGVKTYKPTRYTREKKPWKMFTLFKKGLTIEFNQGINVIVGENGSGKTTLFHLLKHYSGKPIDKLALSWHPELYKDEEDYFQKYQKEYTGELKVEGDLTYRNTIYFDAEKDNPVVAIPQMINPGNKNFLNLTAALFDAQEESHGESMLPVLTYILQNAKNCTIFMDEPETALSLKNQYWLVKQMIKSSIENKNQIIISTHALGIIQHFPMVFDMEAREWINRETYLLNLL
jgi:predicted ATPase